MTEEAAIRELLDGFVKAIRARDLNGVMAVFAPDVVSFDLGPPLEHAGGETFRKRWRELFDAWVGDSLPRHRSWACRAHARTALGDVSS